MTKHHLYILLIASLITPFSLHAKPSLECDSEQSIASRIHKMMLEGTGLDRVLTLFNNNDSARAIARSLYLNIKSIDNEHDAKRVGLVICKLRKRM